MAAHGESLIDCHCKTNDPPHQCAGAAIYRANVYKVCRDKGILQLEPDTEKVFASAEEFYEHHTRKKVPRMPSGIRAHPAVGETTEAL